MLAASPSQTSVLPPFPRHTPVILMGAAILRDGRATASRCRLSVVMSTILEAGKTAFKDPTLPRLGPAQSIKNQGPMGEQGAEE